MIILGIDPGTATTGCGLIKTSKKAGAKPVLISYEKIVTLAGHEMCGRLKKLHDDLSRIVKRHQPDALSVERLFFNTNVKTAMTVGQARGVIMLVAAEQGVPFFEYTALQAKKVLTGFGRADKKEMRKAVQKFLVMSEEIKSDDCADALAMAVCHLVKTVKGYADLAVMLPEAPKKKKRP